MKRLIAIVALALLGACSFTSYTPMWMGYGYADTRLSADTFEVTFQGFDTDSTSKTAEQALLRSAEVTLANGFTHFVVLTEKSEIRVNKRELPATSTTETTTTETRNRPDVKESKTISTTTYVPAKTVEDRQAITVQTIRCYRGDDTRDLRGGTLHDAGLLWRDLSAKYRIKREPKR